MSAASWVPWRLDDLDDTLRLAEEAHPSLPERPEVLARKAELFPAGALALRAAGGPLLGYALSHPWPTADVPPLDHWLPALPRESDCLFVHDVVVAPAVRGMGSAARLMVQLRGVARDHGLRRLALVGVYGTPRLWGRHGFTPSAACPAKLALYGDGACYMTAEPA